MPGQVQVWHVAANLSKHVGRYMFPSCLMSSRDVMQGHFVQPVLRGLHQLHQRLAAPALVGGRGRTPGAGYVCGVLAATAELH